MLAMLRYAAMLLCYALIALSKSGEVQPSNSLTLSLKTTLSGYYQELGPDLLIP